MEYAIYVNGMNNNKKDVLTSERKINSLLTPSSRFIVSNDKVNMSYVHNESLGVGNDLIEYVIDRPRLVGISDPWKYYKFFSSSTAMDSALLDKVNKRKEFLPSGYTFYSGLSFKELSNVYLGDRKARKIGSFFVKTTTL